MLNFIKKHSNHESPLEHVQITVHIIGISRALSHQLVRHRIASYSQMSQRYVKSEAPEYIIPPSIAKNAEAHIKYEKILQRITKCYNELTKLNISTEDARYVMPQATETKIIVSMNIRSWRHFFAERCCMKAQWEIRNVANEILHQFKTLYPGIFENSGPRCLKYNKCLENKPCNFFKGKIENA